MISGDGTGENLRGILNTSGIQSQDGTGMPSAEAILRGITKVRLAFLEPNAVLMHPNDYMQARLATDANGNYILGPPNLPGPAQAWGLPIVQSTVVTEGTAIVGKWDEAVLWVREGASISASDSHSDFFVRNMVAVLGEGRFAFGVPRPAAFCQVTAV
jgi:HK97 family phage major capsid protein